MIGITINNQQVNVSLLDYGGDISINYIRKSIINCMKIIVFLI